MKIKLPKEWGIKRLGCNHWFERYQFIYGKFINQRVYNEDFIRGYRMAIKDIKRLNK